MSLVMRCHCSSNSSKTQQRITTYLEWINNTSAITFNLVEFVLSVGTQIPYLNERLNAFYIYCRMTSFVKYSNMDGYFLVTVVVID